MTHKPRDYNLCFNILCTECGTISANDVEIEDLIDDWNERTSQESIENWERGSFLPDLPSVNVRYVDSFDFPRDKIYPCPFCFDGKGGDTIYFRLDKAKQEINPKDGLCSSGGRILTTTKPNDKYRGFCGCCGVETDYCDTPQVVIENWNRRAPL